MKKTFYEILKEKVTGKGIESLKASELEKELDKTIDVLDRILEIPNTAPRTNEYSQDLNLYHKRMDVLRPSVHHDYHANLQRNLRKRNPETNSLKRKIETYSELNINDPRVQKASEELKITPLKVIFYANEHLEQMRRNNIKF